MNFYAAALILWLLVLPLTIAGCVGIWNVCAHCWREYQHASNKVGAGAESCAQGEFGVPQGPTAARPDNTFPEAWARRPYDREREAS